ncbi:hypothetical protein [Paenibacillus durus]|uniref:Uncharacterized protein n=1 Tax=Paenibacillus durus TaxID=44251 RepID=A0A089HUQ1_PAEDU|nr:hypothetical protein [Paenibacillus durus]AIQ14093.1 hypothetical protein PDUR_20885 [Paenibacillus durus]
MSLHIDRAKRTSEHTGQADNFPFRYTFQVNRRRLRLIAAKHHAQNRDGPLRLMSDVVIGKRDNLMPALQAAFSFSCSAPQMVPR